MNAQSYLKTTLTRNISSLAFFISEPAIVTTPKEMGYEIDEDELADEMLAELPAHFQDQPAPSISPDEFETAYNWFIS
jgi:hypothetical protein